jgi:hypothetical protein
MQHYNMYFSLHMVILCYIPDISKANGKGFKDIAGCLLSSEITLERLVL